MKSGSPNSDHCQQHKDDVAYILSRMTYSSVHDVKTQEIIDYKIHVGFLQLLGGIIIRLVNYTFLLCFESSLAYFGQMYFNSI